MYYSRCFTSTGLVLHGGIFITWNAGRIKAIISGGGRSRYLAGAFTVTFPYHHIKVGINFIAITSHPLMEAAHTHHAQDKLRTRVNLDHVCLCARGSDTVLCELLENRFMRRKLLGNCGDQPTTSTSVDIIA